MIPSCAGASSAEGVPPRAVTLHAIHVDAVRRRNPAALEALMPGRMEKACRFRFERDRLLCLGAGFLLLEALGPETAALCCGENGKPFLPGGPAFNLSHSGEWCVLAVGEACIGADIEQLDERHLGIASMVYTPGELAWMGQDNPLERFYALWTWKESVMKATGLGMALEPASFEVLPFTQGKPVFLRDTLWYAQSGALDGYRYSVCTQYPMKGIQWVEHDD